LFWLYTSRLRRCIAPVNAIASRKTAEDGSGTNNIGLEGEKLSKASPALFSEFGEVEFVGDFRLQSPLPFLFELRSAEGSALRIRRGSRE